MWQRTMRWVLLGGILCLGPGLGYLALRTIGP